MVTTPYTKGYRFEKMVANKLRQIVDDVLDEPPTTTYRPLVIESRGSKGAIDVVLIVDDKAAAVQCKKRKLSDRAMLRLLEHNFNKHAVTTYFAYMRNRKVVFWPDIVPRIREMLGGATN